MADPTLDSPLQVLAITGLLLGFSTGDPDKDQRVSSTATLINQIRIPEPVDGLFSEVLRVQVATEIRWGGGIVVTGVDSTYGQVSATLQVRDVTDATVDDPGPVIASDTFLFERIDAFIDIDPSGGITKVLEILELLDLKDIANSTGSDVTAWLKRGRTYAIELQAKCQVGGVVLGFGLCTFTPDFLTELGIDAPPGVGPLFEDDGFAVGDIHVTVASDPVQDFVGN